MILAITTMTPTKKSNPSKPSIEMIVFLFIVISKYSYANNFTDKKTKKTF